MYFLRIQKHFMTKSNTQGTLHIMVSWNGECPNIANILLFYISHFWHGYVGYFFYHTLQRMWHYSKKRVQNVLQKKESIPVRDSYRQLWVNQTKRNLLFLSDQLLGVKWAIISFIVWNCYIRLFPDQRGCTNFIYLALGPSGFWRPFERIFTRNYQSATWEVATSICK